MGITRRQRLSLAGSLLLSLLFPVVLASAQGITEFAVPTPDAKPFRIVAGPDGNLWFTEQSARTGGKIGRITPDGVITEFPLPSGVSGMGITSGPDGALWFTEYPAAQICRVTTVGAVTCYDTPPTYWIGPWLMTSGPDGNLWFVEFPVNRIGRITPAGAFAEFAVPDSTDPVVNPKAAVFGITSGTDGGIWFAELTGKVGRLSTDGQVTAYVDAVDAYEIAAGVAGDLWYTENDLGFNAIGHITAAGEVGRSFPIPTPKCRPGALAVDAAGNVWFTENDGGKIGRLSPAGVIDEFAIPTPASQPIAIVVGPDGRIWFTEMGGNKIGRLDTAPSPCRRCPRDVPFRQASPPH